MRTMFWGEGCHRGVAVGGWSVTVGDWGVIVRVVVIEVDITVGEIGVTNGTMVVTLEGWFITAVGAWWGGSAEQGTLAAPLNRVPQHPSYAGYPSYATAFW